MSELAIGEFARRCGLSLKALRLYDARGLLPPVRVDEATGYRFYSPEQLERAHTIALLRRLDMPLTTIAEVLAQPPEGVGATLRGWWRERRRELSERGPEVDLVLTSLGADASLHATGRFGVDDVVVTDQPARSVASLQQNVVQDDLVATIMADVTELRGFLGAAGAHFGAEYWVLFHGAVGFDGDGPVEVCVPYEGLVAPAGSVHLRHEPSHRLAYVPVTAADCRYPEIIAAYVALETWLVGRETAGAVREVYPVPWSDDAVVVHVAQPIR
ncbi:MerR family transcriptional regulator [Cellulomonas sp. URHE0023]|uniref:MerR family transcriptional regulator n=1 Tax=Cellulomonas sp. URHE0023 TaxID=1380354 RepID=UPI00055182B7|nr:helix-turn-helix domain-containing protein [Cellulomonas sp. URHE0023]